MKNKNAEITAEEVLKLVISVLCIIILVILAAKLYGIFIKKTDLEQAKESLTQLMAKIKALEEGDLGAYMVTSPKDWYLVFYKKEGGTPKDCLMKDCLCICRGFNIKDCDSGGVCQNVEKEINIQGWDYEHNELQNYLILKPLPLNLFLVNKEGIIKISKSQLKEEYDLFDNFLSSKSDFTDKGEITIEEQIRFFVNSRDNEEKNNLTKNIQNYFSEYEFLISISIREEGDLATLSSILMIDAGKDKRKLNQGEIGPSWPVLIIKNLDKKNIIVTIDRSFKNR